MKLGKISFIILLNFFINNLSAENKITTSPLVNLEKLNPSYEDVEKNEDYKEIKSTLKTKSKTDKKKSKDVIINLLGLDKITAKTSKIDLKIGEVKKFGVLEIKALKCGKIDYLNSKKEAAYIQVKDLTMSDNEKIFIFNGWTFSTDQNVSPIDHAIYDIWLTGCNNV